MSGDGDRDDDGTPPRELADVSVGGSEADEKIDYVAFAGWMRKHCPAGADPEDLTQTAFLKWQRLVNAGVEMPKPEAVLYRIGERVLWRGADHRKRVVNQLSRREPFDEDVLPQRGPTAEADVLRSERLALLQRALLKLGPRDRANVLRGMAGESAEERADALAISSKLATMTLSRAVNRLRRILDEMSRAGRKEHGRE